MARQQDNRISMATIFLSFAALASQQALQYTSKTVKLD